MKKITAALIALSLGLALFAACGQTYRLEGKVLDNTTSEPIVGASVSLNSLVTTTDEMGRYAFDNINEGTYDIVFKASGYETREFFEYEIIEGKFLNTMLIPLETNTQPDAGDEVDGGYKNPEYTDIPEPPPPPGDILDKKPDFTKYTNYSNLRVTLIDTIASSNAPREPMIINVANGITQATMRDSISGDNVVAYMDGNIMYEIDKNTGNWRKVIHPSEVGDQLNPVSFVKMYFDFLFDVLDNSETVVSSLPDTTINDKTYKTYYISGMSTDLTKSYGGEVYLSPGNPTIVGLDGKFYQSDYAMDIYVLLDSFGDIALFTLPQTDDVIDLSDMSAPPPDMAPTPPEGMPEPPQP